MKVIGVISGKGRQARLQGEEDVCREKRGRQARLVALLGLYCGLHWGLQGEGRRGARTADEVHHWFNVTAA